MRISSLLLAVSTSTIVNAGCDVAHLDHVGVAHTKSLTPPPASSNETGTYTGTGDDGSGLASAAVCKGVALACNDPNLETVPDVALDPLDAPDAACGLDQLLAAGVAACGPAVDVTVADGGSIDGALASCHGFCQVHVPAGSFTTPSSLSCAALIGAGRGQTKLEGATSLSNAGLVSLTLHGADYAVSVSGDVAFTSDAEIVGDYASLGKNGTSTDLRVCASVLRAGYVGIDVAWQSVNALVSGTAIAACYDGIDVNWGSSEVQVHNSFLDGGFSGINVDWGSFDVDIADSVVEGAQNTPIAVDDQPDASTGGTVPTHNVTQENVCLIDG